MAITIQGTIQVDAQSYPFGPIAVGSPLPPPPPAPVQKHFALSITVYAATADSARASAVLSGQFTQFSGQRNVVVGTPQDQGEFVLTQDNLSVRTHKWLVSIEFDALAS